MKQRRDTNRKEQSLKKKLLKKRQVAARVMPKKDRTELIKTVKVIVPSIIVEIKKLSSSFNSRNLEAADEANGRRDPVGRTGFCLARNQGLLQSLWLVDMSGGSHLNPAESFVTALYCIRHSPLLTLDDMLILNGHAPFLG